VACTALLLVGISCCFDVLAVNRFFIIDKEVVC
jgi:hypothetical protein